MLNQLEILEKIFEFYNKKPLDKSKYIFWLHHAHKYKNSYERNTMPINENYEEIMQKIKNEICSGIFEKNVIFNDIWKILHEMYESYITKLHY